MRGSTKAWELLTTGKSDIQIINLAKSTKDLQNLAYLSESFWELLPADLRARRRVLREDLYPSDFAEKFLMRQRRSKRTTGSGPFEQLTTKRTFALIETCSNATASCAVPPGMTR